MSDWNTVSLQFDPFASLRDPTKGALQALEAGESILEALLDIIKPFLQDLSNPFKSLIALMLAAVRTLKKQLQATGFSILLVHPDFSRQDLSSVFQSVAGSYSSFESKVYGKFFDSSDIYRPTYPDGSSVAMFVFYIGADNPNSLMKQLMSLLSFIKHPKLLPGLPSPTDFKVRPALKSDDPAAITKNVIKQFSNLWGKSYEKALVLEWRMPSAPSGSSSPSFINQFSTFVNSFVIPNFIVERSVSPTGESVLVELDSQTSNPGIQKLMNKFNFPPPSSKTELKEENGNTYKNFADARIDVSGTRLAEGFSTGTYRFVDNDPNLVPGQTYYYRVRAYFGTPTTWMKTGLKSNVKLNPDGSYDKAALQTAADTIGKSAELTKSSNNIKYINYGKNVLMGQSSAIVKGYIPRDLADFGGFNPYNAIYDAVRAGLLLNFEFPAADSGENPTRIAQKAGWGTLSAAGGQVGALKAGVDNAIDLSKNIIFKTTARRIANNTLTAIQNSPQLVELIQKKWVQGGVQETVIEVLGPEDPFGNRIPSINWKFISISGRGTPTDKAKIESYLAKEDSYKNGVPLSGPFPVKDYKISNELYGVDEEARKALAEFLNLCLSLNFKGSYLSWYSVTLGDLFPAFIPFIFDFDQFLNSLMKAVDSVLKEVDAIIDTILQKIQQIEMLLKTIAKLIDLLDIDLNISVLGVSSPNGSATSLASALVDSTSKPSDDPHGFHSGMVMTFGGPGAGSVAAFKALAFILSLNHFG